MRALRPRAIALLVVLAAVALGLPRVSFAYALFRPTSLFYRGSALFLGWLEQQDGARFRSWLLGVEEGRPFADAFILAYG